MMQSMKKRPDKKSTTEEARPRGGPARNIADIVPNIGRAAFRRFGFVQSSIVTRWGDIVGHTYAEVSAPESIRFPAGQKAGGTLSLVVASGFAPMMQHVLPEIVRSEEHTSELQSLMRISYAVFCLKKKNNIKLNKKQ